MGYTHYFNFENEIGEFSNEALNDVSKVIVDYKNIIQCEYDNPAEPEIGLDAIVFNGIGEDGHETFYVDPNYKEHSYCKTARKPYDLPVCISLLVFKHHYGENFRLYSDGFYVSKEDFEKQILDENWPMALDYVKNNFGYEFILIPQKSFSDKSTYYKFLLKRKEDAEDLIDLLSMSNIISNYVEKDRENEIKKDSIDSKIKKLNEQIKRLQDKKDKIGYVYWIDEVVKPLGEELAKRLNKKYKIFGPFGLRCQTSIYLFDEEGKTITEQETLRISLVPGNLRNGEIEYETGEVKNKFGKNTIGEINGMNNVTKELPSSINEIIKLLR